MLAIDLVYPIVRLSLRNDTGGEEEGGVEHSKGGFCRLGLLWSVW